MRSHLPPPHATLRRHRDAQRRGSRLTAPRSELCFQKTTWHAYRAVFYIGGGAAEGVSVCIIYPGASSPGSPIGTGAYMVARRLMIDPRDLAAKKIVFEEGYVMTLEFNTPPFLTHRVALSKAFFSALEQGPRSLLHFRTARHFESLFVPSGPQSNKNALPHP